MSLGEKIMEEGYAGLPAGARHAISAAVYGAAMVFFFFVFIREPLNAATIADGRQDGVQNRQQASIDKLSEAVNTLVQTQAVQTNTVANLQNNQERTDKILDRIEDKIDKLRQGR